MSVRREEQPRAEGPAMLDSGDHGRPGLLVLDPAGAGKHGEPPASWHELQDLAHITWLRLPAIEAAVSTARSVLGKLTDDGRRVHLLASGPAAPLAELLALEKPGALRSVLLVDPRPATELVDRGMNVVEQGLVAHRTVPTAQVLAGHGVELHVVTYRDAERADRGAPLPLGHPRVVEAVRDALGDEARPLTPPAARQPATPIKRPGLLRRLWQRLRRPARGTR